jgi:triacylglycerol lipase
MWGVATMTDLSYPEPFAFLASDDAGNIYLAFRGSETTQDFWEDADVSQVTYDPVVPNFGSVHAGFLNVYTTAYDGWGYTVASLRTTILEALNELNFRPTALYFASHSLGAGLSTLCVPDVATNAKFKTGVPLLHYSLASPRVGDPNFAYNYNFQLPVSTFRTFNTEDIVPYGPPAVMPESMYEHVGVPVCFTAHYDTVDGNHQYKDCYFYALNNPEQPQGPVSSAATKFAANEPARVRMVEARRRLEALKPG